MASLLSPADLADLNRARVLRALCDHGPQSRADLARLTGVARATTGKIAQTLLDAHLLEEGAPVLGGGVGKPARPLWFAPGAGPSVAIDLRGGGAEIAAIDARGEILASERTALAPAVTGAEAADVLLAAAKRVALGLKPLGVGVALPGVTDPTTGAVIGSGQLPGIVGTDLAEALAEVGPVVIDNDAQAQALAEKWFGLGRGVPTFASVQTGEGLGAG